MADLGNKARWAEIVKVTRKCPYCPKHGKENASPVMRPDRYKDVRKERT
jgi:hypothetical protein